MKRFVIGDIHGNYKALLQCLERSGFDKQKDLLIQLGDVADGWHEVFECVEELLTIKNTIFIKGNHDQWLLDWIERGAHPDNWIQGGEGTLRSYTKRLGFSYEGSMSSGFRSRLTYLDFPSNHLEFWKKQRPYYKDDENNLFVHGGFNRHYTLDYHVITDKHIFWWDRDLFYAAQSAQAGNQKLKFKEEFKNIFIGHTQTTHWGTTLPIFAERVINIDTGAGWNGVLTIMDVDTKQFWQSDAANFLYPGEIGRR